MEEVGVIICNLTNLRLAYKRVCEREVKRNARRRVWNDLGIRQAARELDVCYSHLSRALRGERGSDRLLARYVAWRRGTARAVSR